MKEKNELDETTSKATVTVNSEKKTMKVKEFLEYNFTQKEIKEKSHELARKTQEITSLENEKKAIASNYKAQIETKQSETNMLAINISTGREMRHVECVITMNSPVNGKKTLTRTDDGSVVWEKNMTTEEMQLKLDLDNQNHVDSATVKHSEADDNHRDLPED